jgi:hypothetical protein
MKNVEIGFCIVIDEFENSENTKKLICLKIWLVFCWLWVLHFSQVPCDIYHTFCHHLGHHRNVWYIGHKYILSLKVEFGIQIIMVMLGSKWQEQAFRAQKRNFGPKISMAVWYIYRSRISYGEKETLLRKKDKNKVRKISMF